MSAAGIRAGHAELMDGVYRRQRMTASFMHAYFPSHPDAAVGLFLP